MVGASVDFEGLLKKYDTKHAIPFLRTFPQQCREALELGKSLAVAKDRDIAHIVVAGMGGSGIGGRLLKNLLKKELDIPLDFYNSYSLPRYADEQTLAVISSYSGNTEETISCLEEAREKKCLTLYIGTGGKLKGKADHEIIFPAKAPQPRMAIPFLCLPLLPVLEKLGLVRDMQADYGEMTALLEKEAQAVDALAQQLAQELKGTFPIVYASDEMDAVAYRWVCEFNENSKIFAHWQAIPEMGHNEINSKTAPPHTAFVYLRSAGESSRIRKRFEVTQELFKDIGKKVEIQGKGESLLARVFYHIFIDELTTAYLAMLAGKDPEPIPAIRYLKKRLAE